MRNKYGLLSIRCNFFERYTKYDEYIYRTLYDNLILIRFENLFVFSDSVALILILLKNFCNKIFNVMSDADFIFQKVFIQIYLELSVAITIKMQHSKWNQRCLHLWLWHLYISSWQCALNHFLQPHEEPIYHIYFLRSMI